MFNTTLKQQARTLCRDSLLTAESILPRRPYIAIWGNCQAEALRKLLESSETLSERYSTVRLPGVHEVTPRQLPSVMRVIGGASVILVQPVRNNYRKMFLGTDQVLTAARKDAKVFRFPTMFYAGLHPYLRYVHASGEVGTNAPLTNGYHDLRIIAMAIQGVGDDAALGWIAEHKGDPVALRTAAERSGQELAWREKDLDVAVSAMIKPLGASAFWTLNHPSNAVLAVAVAQVHSLLALGQPGNLAQRERLASVVVPVHRNVRDALGLPPGPVEDAWVVDGARHDDEAVIRAHLAFYRESPGILASATAEHSKALGSLGLVPH